MKHKRIHAKITKHLEQKGDATTGELREWLRGLRPENGSSRGTGFGQSQSLNVLGNVLKRRPIVKVGFDNQARQAIWGIRDSE